MQKCNNIKSGTARWNRRNGKVGEWTRSFQASPSSPHYSNLHVFTNLEDLQVLSFWVLVTLLIKLLAFGD